MIAINKYLLKLLSNRGEVSKKHRLVEKENKMKTNLKHVSIKKKILIPVVMLNTFACISIGIWLSSSMKKNMIQIAAEQSEMAAQFAVQNLDTEVLKSIGPGDEDSQAYQQITEELNKARKNTSIKYVYTLTSDGTTVTYGVDGDGKELIGSKFTDSYEELKPAFEGQSIKESVIDDSVDGELITSYVPIFNSNNEVIGILGCDYDATDIVNKSNKITFLVFFITLGELLLLISLCTAIITKIMAPIKTAVNIADKMHSNDLSETTGIIISNDEIGQLTQAFLDVSNRLRTIISDINYQLEELGKGNFQASSSCPEIYQGDYEGISLSMKKIRTELSLTLSEIYLTAQQVDSGADQVSSGAQAISQGATEQASSVEELSYSLTNVTKQANDNFDNVRKAIKRVDQTTERVNDGTAQMKGMMKAMESIAQSSRQITGIINVIEDIAFQTNILALNAAVEAARAGYAGKGFAVVADEVRNLAAKSAEAAKQSTQLIIDSTEKVTGGIEIASKLETILLEITQKNEEVNDLIVQIDTATAVQAETISRITEGLEQISTVVQTNATTAEESSASSEELSAQATMLREKIQRFKIDM